MTFFTASFETVLFRYFLMMAVIIAAFTFGYPVLALLSFPLFIAAFAAVSFKTKNRQIKAESNHKEANEITMINTAA